MIWEHHLRQEGEFLRFSLCRALKNSPEQISLQTPIIIMGKNKYIPSCWPSSPTGRWKQPSLEEPYPHSRGSLGFWQRGMLSRHHPNSTEDPQGILNPAFPLKHRGGSSWRSHGMDNEVTPPCPGVAAGKIHSESQGILCIPSQALGNPPGFGSGMGTEGLGSSFWVSIKQGVYVCCCSWLGWQRTLQLKRKTKRKKKIF